MEAAERARDVIAAAEAEARRIVESARDEAARVPAAEPDPAPRPAVRPVVRPAPAVPATPPAALGTVSWRPDGSAGRTASVDATPAEERELAMAGGGKPKRRFLFFKRS
jgi:hypothetical protein